jgi:hypothetical protein
MSIGWFRDARSSSGPCRLRAGRQRDDRRDDLGEVLGMRFHAPSGAGARRLRKRSGERQERERGAGAHTGRCFHHDARPAGREDDGALGNEASFQREAPDARGCGIPGEGAFDQGRRDAGRPSPDRGDRRREPKRLKDDATVMCLDWHGVGRSWRDAATGADLANASPPSTTGRRAPGQGPQAAMGEIESGHSLGRHLGHCREWDSGFQDPLRCR